MVGLLILRLRNLLHVTVSTHISFAGAWYYTGADSFICVGDHMAPQ